ncbi:MAG: prepilin peptidase [Planctomycetes bacterium]|nr:prepilin peptidase [Planctomycetota bacterium]
MSFVLTFLAQQAEQDGFLSFLDKQPAILIVYAVLLGMFFGSFLNVVVYRLPRRCLSINNPRRSFCPNCKHQLAAIDNIPVLSWVWLRAKCRYCKLPISVRYPLVEATTGALFGLTVWRTLLESHTLHEPMAWLTCAAILLMILVLVPIALIDADLTVIPDELSLGSLILFIPLAANPGAMQFGLSTKLNPLMFTSMGWPLWLNSMLSAVATGLAASLFLWLMGKVANVIFAKRAAEMGGEAMGFGDVKLMMLLGVTLGWPKLVVGFFIAVFIGASFGLALRLTRKQIGLPFGPSLVVGALGSMLFAKELSLLVDMYLKLLTGEP